MDNLKRMLAEQHAALSDLSSELQRKEVTPARVVRLMKIVSREVDILERMAKIFEAVDARLQRIESKPDAGSPTRQP